jgi:polyhydroxybutyrate depolymerase
MISFMLNTLIRLAALWLASVGLLVGGAAHAGQWQDQSLQSDGATRVYRVYVPNSAKPNAPSVVVLHGGGQSMRKIFAPTGGANLAWLAVADREGVVLIVPNGTNRDNGDPLGEQQNWNDLRNDTARVAVDDVAFIKRVLQAEVPRLKLDPKRVHVTGASNGGMMSMRLLIEAPELFAAAATFIGNQAQAGHTHHAAQRHR